MNFLPYFVYWLLYQDRLEKLQYCQNSTSGENGICLSEKFCMDVGKGFNIGYCGTEESTDICCNIVLKTHILNSSTFSLTVAPISSEAERSENNVYAFRRGIKNHTRMPEIDDWTHYLKDSFQDDLIRIFSKTVRMHSKYDVSRPVEVHVTHNMRRPVETHPTHDMRRPVKTHPTHDMRRPVETHPMHDMRKPVETHSTHDMRKPVETHPTHDMRRPVETHPTHDMRRAVQLEESHDMRRPVQLEESHDLRWPVIEEKTHDMRTPVQTHPTHDMRTPVETHFTHDMRRPVQFEKSHDFRRPVINGKTQECKTSTFRGNSNSINRTASLQKKNAEIQGDDDEWKKSLKDSNLSTDNFNGRASNRWPWVASLKMYLYNQYWHKCGASLLNNLWVVTAAHCVDLHQKWEFILTLGSLGNEANDLPQHFIDRHLDRIVIHPLFNRATFEHDLALLRMTLPVEFGYNISPICLPWNLGQLEGTSALVLGWKRLESDNTVSYVFHASSVPVLKNTECEDVYSKQERDETMLDDFLCAGVEDGKYAICDGDSGGPLATLDSKGRWSLIGLISWDNMCLTPNRPRVYVRISRYAQWIEDTMACFNR